MARVTCTINGRRTVLDGHPLARLLDVLRGAGFTGTKEGCGEGECGACTVSLDGLPVNSCLVPTYQVRGRRVETVESLSAARLDPLLTHGATQCGACTPGVAVTSCWIIDHPDLLRTHTVRELLAGNLCRCTGYDGILDGINAALQARP